MAAQIRYPELHDPAWLRRRYVREGLTRRQIAALVGSSDVTVGHALKRHGVARPRGWTPPAEPEPPTIEPERDFAPLSDRLELADLDADVAPDELARRLEEGLHDLATLAELAERTSRDALWDLLVSQVDPATARAVAFTAALIAARQGSRADLAPSSGPPRMR